MKRTRIYSAVFTILMFAVLTQCDDSTSPSPPGAYLDSLQVEVLQVRIFADLMPIVPPDPIFSRIEMRLENTYRNYSIESLKISAANVMSKETGEQLGQFRYTTDWPGELAPGEVDTVTWTKIQEDYTPIDSVHSTCGDSLTLQFSLVEQEQDSLHLSVEDIVFGCAW